MARLNVRFLLILAITFVLLTAGVVVVHGIQMNSNVDSLIKRAEKAKVDDPREAVRLLRLHHSRKPDDLEHAADYAMAAADVLNTRNWGRREFDEAVGALEQILRGAVPENREGELRRKVVELHMAAGRYAVAKEHLLKLKAKGLADAKTDLQLAQCIANTGDYMSAIQLLESLIGYDSKTKTFDVAKAKSPKELKAYWNLATLLHDKVTDSKMLDRKQLADRVIDQMVDVNSDSAQAFLMQAQYQREHQTREKAAVALARAKVLEPDNVEVL
jgi:tetratricopeptide (TPR) repeat protein